MILIILVEPNWNGPFHLISNQNFQNFGLNKRCPKSAWIDEYAPWVLPPVLHCNSKTNRWKRYIKLVCHCFKCNVVQEPKGLVKLYSIALTLTTQKSPLGVGLGLSHTHIPVTFIWQFPLPLWQTALQTSWGWPLNFTVLTLAFFLGFILHH